jgi:hypothetical protein
MSKSTEILSKAGLNSIGICSTLWVDSDGAFRAGLFRYRGLLHLAVFLKDDRFWVTSVANESVEICLRGGSSLYELASCHKYPYILEVGKLKKAGWADRIRLWWELRTNPPDLLPNYYYLWNEYCFSKKI